MDNIKDFYGTPTEKYQSLPWQQTEINENGVDSKKNKESGVTLQAIRDEVIDYLASRGLNVSPSHSDGRNMKRLYIGSMLKVQIPIEISGKKVTTRSTYSLLVPCSRPSYEKKIDCNFVNQNDIGFEEFESLLSHLVLSKVKKGSKLDNVTYKDILKEPEKYIAEIQKIDKRFFYDDKEKTICFATELKKQSFRILIDKDGIIDDSKYGGAKPVYNKNGELIDYTANYDLKNNDLLEAILPYQMIPVRGKWAEKYEEDKHIDGFNRGGNSKVVSTVRELLPRVQKKLIDRCSSAYQQTMYFLNTHHFKLNPALRKDPKLCVPILKDLFYKFIKTNDKDTFKIADLLRSYRMSNNHTEDVPLYTGVNELRGLNFAEALVELEVAAPYLDALIKLDDRIRLYDTSFKGMFSSYSEQVEIINEDNEKEMITIYPFDGYNGLNFPKDENGDIDKDKICAIIDSMPKQAYNSVLKKQVVVGKENMKNALCELIDDVNKAKRGLEYNIEHGEIDRLLDNVKKIESFEIDLTVAVPHKS